MAVFLFPGQGAQSTGMGMDLFELDADRSLGIRDLFTITSDLLHKDVAQILTSDGDTLRRTDVSQVAITLVSLSAARLLASRGITPDACAGFSLGEYPALAVAGVLSETDALKVTIERGRVMQAACDRIQAQSSVPPGMAAVLGLPSEQIEAIIRDNGVSGLYPANYNSPLQTVVSGTAEALETAERLFKEAGARRCIRLSVAGPFHSPLMGEAATEFAQFLESIAFSDPSIPLFSNVTGSRLGDRAQAKARAVEHISNPVRWTKEEQSISTWWQSFCAQTGTEHDSVPLSLVEVGPGKVLCGLWRDSKLPGECKSYTECL